MVESHLLHDIFQKPSFNPVIGLTHIELQGHSSIPPHFIVLHMMKSFKCNQDVIYD
jgi:hypothetical protein